MARHSRRSTSYRVRPSGYTSGGVDPNNATPNSGSNTGGSGGYVSAYDGVYRVRKKRRSHALRNTLIVIFILILIVAGVGGFTGWTLYNSAKEVRSEASAVMKDLSDLRGQLLSENGAQAKETAKSVSKHAQSMVNETSGWAWDVATIVPVYGDDVKKVRELSAVLVDLSDNAVTPLVDSLSQASLSNLFSDGAINVELAQQLITALGDAAPVIARSTTAVEVMGEAVLPQVNEPLSKARTMLEGLNSATQFAADVTPTFPDMVGANGRRTYAIIALSSSEMRSAGGFLGHLGPLYIENGHLELGEFDSVSSINPPSFAPFVPITDDELEVFGQHVSWQMQDVTFIPDFSRVSEIVKYAWEAKGFDPLDGVIGVDPVFLQYVLGLVGPVTTSEGVELNGDNAAEYLLKDVYFLDKNEEQNETFKEVAEIAFDRLMANLGGVSLTSFMDVVSKGIETRHFQWWMNTPSEEEAVIALGADGKLSHNAAKPTLGVFFSEESYSKLFWYFKAEPVIGEGVRNADGSMTYPVTVTYWNMVQPDQVDAIPPYAKSHNGTRRSDAEMLVWLMLSAPEGGFISDMQTEGDFVQPEVEWRGAGDRTPITGNMSQMKYQGLDFWIGFTRTLPGQTFTAHFNVTTSALAQEPLKVVHTAGSQEVAGW